MMRHDVTIGGQVEVGLDDIGAKLPRELESGEGVLGREIRRTSMPDDEPGFALVCRGCAQRAQQHTQTRVADFGHFHLEIQDGSLPSIRQVRCRCV